MTNSIHELSDSACVFAIGANTTAAHPVIWVEILQGLRRGGKLIVANPRYIRMCKYADIWLQHKPGTDVPLVMGLARVIRDDGLLDRAFIDERCEGFEAFSKSLDDFDLDTVERITGVPRDQLVAAARMYATNGPAAIIYAMGITQSSHGTDNVLAIANLAMITGNIGKPSAGVNPLRGQNNVQGACDVGCLPNVYPGYQQVTDAAMKEKYEKAWGATLSDKTGLTLTEIFDSAGKGKVKAVYLVGENPILSDPDGSHIRAGIEGLEFFVVQDIFMTETAQMADVVLPGVSFAEKDGTFTNTERRVQMVRKAIDPVGNACPDWWITCEIAKRMGARGFDYSQPEQIFNEFRSLAPAYGGITYERIAQVGLQWPCPTEDHPGTPILHKGAFVRGKGKFSPLHYIAPLEVPTDEYPFILTNERSLYQFHTGSMTRKTAGLNALAPEEAVQLNPADAARLGIADGDMVKVTSRRGAVSAKARVTDNSPQGVACVSFHFAEAATNLLTNSALDPVAKIPELKFCAVRIEKAAA